MTNPSESAVTEQFELDDRVVTRRTVHASMTDGARLLGYVYEYRAAPTRRGSKSVASRTPLLCIPGDLGNTRELHAFAVAAMVEANAPKCIYIIDLRGRGRSINVPVADSSVETDADDLISFLRCPGIPSCGYAGEWSKFSDHFDDRTKAPGSGAQACVE